MFTGADRFTFLLVWGVLSIISAKILLNVWKHEGKLTLLSYLGATLFGTFLAPIVSTIFFLGWLGTITPSQARNWIREGVQSIKKGCRIKSKQAPPHISVSPNSGILLHPNPPSVHIQTVGPFLNDMMNPYPKHPNPNMARGTKSGPNRMTRLSNGSGAPSWYVPAPPPAVRAKKGGRA
jgi:hypothetical protein